MMTIITPSPSKRQADLHPIGPVAAKIVSDLAFQRRVQRLHDLGPRALAELLAEIICAHGIRPDIDATIRRYAAIPLEALAITGGDKFPPSPIHEVRKTA